MGKNFASVEFQGLMHGPLNPTSSMAYMFLVLGALTAHTERSSIAARTADSAKQRSTRNIGQSRFSPFGTRFRARFPGGEVREAVESGELAGREYHGTKRAPLELVIHEPEAEQSAIPAPYLTKLDGEQDPQEDYHGPSPAFLVGVLWERGKVIDHLAKGVQRGYLDASLLARNVAKAVKYLTEREGKERFAGRVLAAWKGPGM